METPNGGCSRCERLQVSVTVYWDFENCTVPSDMKGFQVVSAVRSYVRTIGGILKNISAFGNLNLLKQELRTELQQSGVLLHDVSSGKPSAADMALMVEFLKLACDCPPPHRVVLISGDRDFSNVLNVLVFRGYEVTLIHSNTATEVLKSAATNAMEWRSFLGKQDVLAPLKVSPRPSSTPPSPLKQPKNEVSTSLVPKQDNITNSVSKTTMPSFTENEKKALKLMEVVLPWLKKEFFKPTETIIQNGCKREYKKRGETFTTSLWNDVLSVIQKYPGFTTYGQGPSRLVYLSSDIFPGIDPSEAPKKAFSSTAWNDLIEFLKTIHPTSKLGRFGFAEFLREKGPLTIRTMPLAKIAQLVQVATNERLLKFDKNALLTVGPEENKQQLPPTPSTQTEIRDGDVIKCINDILLQVKRVQIGGLSAHLERKGLLGYVKQKGSLKGFIQSVGTYDLQMDNKNGLWIVSKDPLHLITSFVSENGGRVNIGTLSGYVHRIGKIKDGLKKFLVSSEMFDFESTKDGGNWVILRSKRNVPIKEKEEVEEISEKVESGEDNQEEIFEEQKSREFLLTDDNMEEFVELEQNDTQEFQQTDQSFDGFDEFDDELKRALELSLSEL